MANVFNLAKQNVPAYPAVRIWEAMNRCSQQSKQFCHKSVKKVSRTIKITAFILDMNLG